MIMSRTPLQNRVDPFGTIHAHPARGTLMGNRGIIHDPKTRTLSTRRWTTKAWIICLCRFKGRRRAVMGPNSYTELFFLDEATALSAGHRPCFECQRARALVFAETFAKANGMAQARAPDIDLILHGERLARPRPTIGAHDAVGLPDGSFVAADDKAYLVKAGKLLRWRFDGYGMAVEFDGGRYVLLTPASIVRTLDAGYRPA
jgi:hypothetical protein